MSRPLDLSKPLTQDQIDDLLTRHPREKVQYWVQVASGDEFDESENDESGEGYGQLTIPELQDQLRNRGLPLSGNKQELVDRLEEDDAQGA